MQRHNRRLFRVVRSVVKDEAEAEDALQDAYLQAFAKLDGYRGEAALATWLTRIALNEAFARLRRRRRADALNHEIEAGMGLIIDFPFQRTAAADPERLAAGAEIRRLLERAIDELPDAFRTVFVLRCVEQLSVEETAAALGVPEETVKTRLHRARAKLQSTIHRQLAGALDDAFPFGGARCARVCAAVLRRLGFVEPPPGTA
jgi:RNA polymerase sigma-70 factor (ECF subfamily)